MRIMALDIGEVRVGIAISDPGERVASPICVLPANEVSTCAKSFKRVFGGLGPEFLLCGLPYTMAGEEGPQAKRIRSVAAQISAACDVPMSSPTSA